MKYDVHIKHFCRLLNYDGWLKGKALLSAEVVPYVMDIIFYYKEWLTDKLRLFRISY